MKNRFFLFSLAVTGLITIVLIGCGSAPAGTGSGSAAASRNQTIERIRVDYQGAAIGSDVPEWVEAAVNRDEERLKRIPRFQGKIVFIDEGQGQNLDLLRSWVNNFNMQAGLSRRIRTYVEAEFGGKQLGSKDTPENQNFLSEMVTNISNAQFSGLAKEMDYWIKLRIVDRGKRTETEQYYYYVVYSMTEADYRYQIDRAMGRISAATREQQEIKNDVETAIRQARFNSIQQAEN